LAKQTEDDKALLTGNAITFYGARKTPYPKPNPHLTRKETKVPTQFSTTEHVTFSTCSFVTLSIVLCSYKDFCCLCHWTQSMRTMRKQNWSQ